MTLARQVPTLEENRGNGNGNGHHHLRENDAVENASDPSHSQNGGHQQSQNVYSTLVPPRFIMGESGYDEGKQKIHDLTFFIFLSSQRSIR